MRRNVIDFVKQLQGIFYSFTPFKFSMLTPGMKVSNINEIRKIINALRLKV